jgi:hypothetical protein
MGSAIWPSSQAVAEHGIAGPDQEEHAGESEKDEVEHGRLPNGRTSVSRAAINVPFASAAIRINGA